MASSCGVQRRWAFDTDLPVLALVDDMVAILYVCGVRLDKISGRLIAVSTVIGASATRYVSADMRHDSMIQHSYRQDRGS